MTVCAIHQPNFAPWLGYFLKIALCDTFVFLDNVLFSKGSYTNRVKIDNGNGRTVWLTVPVEKRGLSKSLIMDVQISGEQAFRDNLMQKLNEYYRQSKHKEELFEILEEVFNSGTANISEFNIKIIEKICLRIGLEADCLKSSDFANLPANSTQRLIKICSIIDAKSYLTGSGGASYLKREEFALSGIALQQYQFIEPMLERKNLKSEGGLSVFERIAHSGFDGLRGSLNEALENTKLTSLE